MWHILSRSSTYNIYCTFSNCNHQIIKIGSTSHWSTWHFSKIQRSRKDHSTFNTGQCLKKARAYSSHYKTIFFCRLNALIILCRLNAIIILCRLNTFRELLTLYNQVLQNIDFIYRRGYVADNMIKIFLSCIPCCTK